MESSSNLGADQPYYTLNNGLKMPLVGLGTYLTPAADIISRAIIEIGYRAIDNAAFYKNEKLVGEAVKTAIDSGKVKREDLFIISKLWLDDFHDVESACKTSLTNLGLDYIDLYLIHWPVGVTGWVNKEATESTNFERSNIPIHKVWPQMEALVEMGLVKSIGVSNFGV